MSYRGIFSCEGKVALVAGGAGLLGSEIAKGLRDFGARVYIADLDMEKAVRLVGENMEALLLDVSSEDSVREAIEKAAPEGTRLDVMVNCSYPRTGDWGAKFEDVRFDSWKKNLDSHLGGCFLLCRAAAEKMKRGGGGSIINLASIYGVGAPDFAIYEGASMTMPAAYAAIKSGVIALTRYVAAYYGGHNVRANAISPGGILDGQPGPFVQRYSRKTQLGRMGAPGDVVGAAVYLASDASSYVTGHNLMVDGGWSAW